MIYVFLAHGFEEIEALATVDILRRAELAVTMVGVGGKAVTGSHGITVAADITENELVLDDQTEMIVLPGGMPGTLGLERSAIVSHAIDFANLKGKYIAAICAAPSILGHKGLLEGKKACCYIGFESQLEGAVVSDEPIVVDGNIITARGAGVAIDFACKLVELLLSKERADLLAMSLLCKR